MNRRMIALALVTLTACAQPNTERDFLCGAQEGQPCHSISDVDGRAPATHPTRAATVTQAAAAPRTAGIVPGTGVRLAEKTGRMFVAPYMGAGGLVHEGSTVQFVVRSARWEQK
ncbi:TraV family lipoprotein [Yoonia sp. SS1-5]|uniref:TraV family lipoprotein n=1 Tax=Yoonia rhodophyticola TaxID=3137370 RepID=A0AAN0M6I4_9RHOB